jgi:hypothetical protein
MSTDSKRSFARTTVSLSEMAGHLKLLPGLCRDLVVGIQKQQADLVEKEAERLRELKLADAGLAPGSSTKVFESGSRLHRPEAPQFNGSASSAPAVAGAKRRASTSSAPAAKRTAVAVPRASSKLAGSQADGPAPSSRISMISASGRSAAKSAVGGSAGGMSSEPGAVLSSAALAGGVSNPELAKLLISTHGKPFPSIQSIMMGAAINRELSGVCSREKDMFSDLRW